MPECCVGGNCSNGKSLTVHTDDNGWGTYCILCRWQRSSNLESWQQLPVVEQCYNPEHNSDKRRQLYGEGNECQFVPECSFGSHSSDSKPVTGDTDDNGGRADDLLCRGECSSYLECGGQLPVVEQCDNTEYYSNDSRQLYSKGDRCELMPECSIGSHCCHSKFIAGSKCRYRCNDTIWFRHNTEWYSYRHRSVYI